MEKEGQALTASLTNKLARGQSPGRIARAIQKRDDLRLMNLVKNPDGPLFSLSNKDNSQEKSLISI